MSNITIILPDNSKIKVIKGTTVKDVALSIGEGLARAAVAGKIDGTLVDMTHKIMGDTKISIITMKSPEGLDIFRHSTAHVLAQAVITLYPDAKPTIGPSIEDGFYYDFDVAKPFSPEDLYKIESKMKEIIKKDESFERIVMSKKDALAHFKKDKNEYKVELINVIPDGEEITFYKSGDFIDLCRGPHVASSGVLKAIKLTKVSGAYWKGDSKNKMLSRIYGVSFPKKSELSEHLEMIAEAEKRDHNKIGRELELFTTNDAIGQGLPLLMPKGAKIIQILQRFIEDEEEKRGYQVTKTPFMAKSDLYKISGHWDHYKDDMFLIDGKDEILALRPMTCPFQFMIYKSSQRSYKDLPLRYYETSSLFRNESSGEMHGLTRMRQFTLSEGHIICMQEQLEDEFKKALSFITSVMKILGIDKDIWYRFSKWDPANKKKYIDNPDAWDKSQKMMKTILDHLKLDYVEANGEAAFYGPKLDIQAKNVYGKEDTIITVQIDFALPERFDMTYVAKDNSKQRPMVVHRSSIGCYERTLAMLIEKYAGAFPTWIAPVQVKMITIADRHQDYAEEVIAKLSALGIRVESDFRTETVEYKIREAQLQKIPYMLVVGDKEIEKKSVTVRTRLGKVTYGVSVDAFIKEITDKIDTKKID
ncbi:MAG: threonine--tRNA ligase [DPANN group archaeon]|nr:threonine--tRNA ligase [DPANN group archaeon]